MSVPPKAPVKPAHGLAKALTHHGHLGKALKAGDTKAAMHHIGHTMRAVRSAMQSTAPAGPPAMPSDASMIGAAQDTEGSAETVGELPAVKKPTFNRAAFGAMKPKGV